MIERRRYQRTPVQQPVVLYFVTNTLEVAAGHTIDVGEGGCALELDDPSQCLAVGRHVLVATPQAATLGRVVHAGCSEVRIEFTTPRSVLGAEEHSGRVSLSGSGA